jgi:hypothetical protein
MASPPLPTDRLPVPRGLPPLRDRVRQTLDRLAATVAPPLRATAFWGAVALPFLNGGLLLDGLSTSAETTAFVALIVLNALALYVGHPHASEDA